MSIAGKAIGVTPLTDIPVPAGKRRLRFTHPRHQAKELSVTVAGRQQPQRVRVELAPNWGEVHYATEPPGARILVDGEDTGRRTPATVEILAGEHEVALLLDGHQTHRQRILVAAQERRAPALIKLRQADALLSVSTRPAGAGVTIDGQYQGESPLRAELRSGRAYRVRVFKAGFAAREASLNLRAGGNANAVPGTQATGRGGFGASLPSHGRTACGRTSGRAGQPNLEAAGPPPRLENHRTGPR